MRILAVDLASVTRKFWELDKEGRLSDGSALTASVQHILRAADGFDRIAICRDIRPSFRKGVCPTYKSGREDPGPVYEKLELDVAKRLYSEGASIFPNTEEASSPTFKIGDGYPEADDVIASLARWFCEVEPGHGNHALRIASEDSDLCALVDDEYQIDMRRFDGSIWTAETVLQKLGYGPDLVPFVKVLAGDDADGYKPFPHHEPKAEGGKTKPGIGEKGALELMEKWGRYGDPSLGLTMPQAVLLAAQDGAAFDADSPAQSATRKGMPESHLRKCLVAGGAAALEMGRRCATMVDDLKLGFDRLLAEPVIRPLAPPQAKPAAPKTPAPMILAPAEPGQFDRLALQPTGLDPLLGVSEMLFNSRMYSQFRTVEEIATVIFEARERGVPAATALRNAYVVKGRPAWSAAFIAGIVKAAPVCKLFRIIETTETQATVEYQRCDELGGPFTFTFTLEEAKRAGWLKSGDKGDGKWITNPRTMLRWAAMREAARAFFPDVVSGVHTPDELRGGHIEDAEFEQTERDMEKVG